MYKEKTFELVEKTFLNLTSKTYPYGYEDGLVEDMIKTGVFPSDLKKDKSGNYFYKIGDSRTIFASHLDTNCSDQTDVVHLINSDINGDITVETDGRTILGADDKAGVTILLWMIKHEIPGTYYFFIGEEVGCIGSKSAASVYLDFKNVYDRIISFDRRGTDSVITHQSCQRTCSDGFAKALSNKLNNFPSLSYDKDSGGIYTDSAEFSHLISECTNLSVGYYNEHTTREIQNLTHLSKLADACVGFDWDNLPSLRDPSKNENSYSMYSYDRLDEWKESRNGKSWGKSWYGSKKKKKRTRSKSKSSRKFLDIGNGDLKHIGDDMLIGKYTNDKSLIDDFDKEGKYQLFKQTFSEKFTRKEIEDIRDQYLYLDDETNVDYYNYLISNLEETSS